MILQSRCPFQVTLVWLHVPAKRLPSPKSQSLLVGSTSYHQGYVVDVGLMACCNLHLNSLCINIQHLQACKLDCMWMRDMFGWWSYVMNILDEYSWESIVALMRISSLRDLCRETTGWLASTSNTHTPVKRVGTRYFNVELWDKVFQISQPCEIKLEYLAVLRQTYKMQLWSKSWTIWLAAAVFEVELCSLLFLFYP